MHELNVAIQRTLNLSAFYAENYEGLNEPLVRTLSTRNLTEVIHFPETLSTHLNLLAKKGTQKGLGTVSFPIQCLATKYNRTVW